MSKYSFKKSSLVFVFVLVCCASFLYAGDTSIIPITQIEEKPQNWFLCREDGIVPTDFESLTIPKKLGILPWVNSTCITGSWSNKNSVFFLINRCGVGEFSLKNGFSVSSPESIDFKSRTSAGVFFVGKTPYFRQYKDAFFSEESGKIESIIEETETKERASIFKWKNASKTADEILFASSFGLSAEYQATNATLIDNRLLVSFKSSDKTKTDFAYREVVLQDLQDFLKLSQPNPGEESTKNIIVSKTLTQDEYRNAIAPKSATAIPAKFKALVEQFKDISFNLHYKDETASNCTEQHFIVGNEPKFTAYGLSCTDYEALLFEDGTLLLMPHEPQIEDVMFYKTRLPRPQENFVYTGIAIKGSYLFGIWEEQFFYSRGRCGLFVNKL